MADEHMLYGLKRSILDQIIKVLRHNPAVEEIILFGSRAKGNYKEGSDIDLCLKGQALTADDLRGLSQAIDALDLPWIVDLLIYHSLNNPALREHIDRVGITLSQSDHSD